MIVISGVGSISPLGRNSTEIWESYCKKQSLIKTRLYNGKLECVAHISLSGEGELEQLIAANRDYADLDRSVLLAIYAAREAVKGAGWDGHLEAGVNIGSSRGATGLFERYFKGFIEAKSAKVPPLTSPTTTLGNISSWVAQDLKTGGVEISHSSTCSTGIQALANAVAWLKAGMCERFLAGAAEAPLTPFTIAQMKALRIYSKDVEANYPCRPCDIVNDRHNTMVLGEGACVFALECDEDGERNITGKPKIQIESIGLATEAITTATTVSAEGEVFREAMRRALEQMETDSPVDAVVLHAPGTIQGDCAELEAIAKVFPGKTPLLLSNKWFIGHTLGASGALSVEYAIHLLTQGSFPEFPYPVPFQNEPRPIRKVLVNSAGFGGSAASVVLSRV